MTKMEIRESGGQTIQLQNLMRKHSVLYSNILNTTCLGTM